MDLVFVSLTLALLFCTLGFAGLCVLTIATRLWAGWRGLPP